MYQCRVASIFLLISSLICVRPVAADSDPQCLEMIKGHTIIHYLEDKDFCRFTRRVGSRLMENFRSKGCPKKVSEADTGAAIDQGVRAVVDSVKRSESMVTFCKSMEPTYLATAAELDRNQATRDLNKCFTAKVGGGRYSSSDGGQSAMLLLAACGTEWRAWHGNCMDGGRSDSDCTVDLGILAQAFLKLSGR